MSIEVTAMTSADWACVRAIYEEGIASGQATFEVEAPSWGGRGTRPTIRSAGWWRAEGVNSSAGRR
jgi:L-amino acid N-acyltransferase YncA